VLRRLYFAGKCEVNRLYGLLVRVGYRKLWRASGASVRAVPIPSAFALNCVFVIPAELPTANSTR
jgi:hypothetical protein